MAKLDMNEIPEVMTGVQLTGHGDFDELLLNRDIPVPKIGEHEVLIKVSAAGVNNTDINTRIGWYSKSDGDSEDASWSGSALQFPFIQGADVCGYVVAVGDKVDKGLMDKRVLIEPCLQEINGKKLEKAWYFGSECNGGFAEYTVVSERHVHTIQCDLTDVELASFPCSYSTAENLLTRADVCEKDTVLVTGASGGVGSAAIQLAKARGAEVIAVTSPSKAQALIDLGADKTIGRDDNLIETLGKNSVDVIVDLVAGEQWPDFLEVLKPFGRYTASGAIAGPIVELDIRTLYLKDLSFFGGTVLNPEVFGNLVKRIEAKDIKPLVDGTFALSEMAEAQKQFKLKHHVGKLVIDLSLDY